MRYASQARPVREDAKLFSGRSAERQGMGRAAARQAERGALIIEGENILLVLVCLLALIHSFGLGNRYGAGEARAGQIQPSHGRQVFQGRRQGTRQIVTGQIQFLQGRQVTQEGRHGTREIGP